MSNNDDKAWTGKTRGGSFGYRFFIFLINKLGLRFAYLFLAFVVVYFIPFAPKATRASWWYARNILKKGHVLSVLFLFKHYYRFGQTLIDKVAVTSGKEDAYRFFFCESYDRFLEVLDQQNGAVMVGAHVGNWEIGTPFFKEYGRKMHVAMLDAEYRKIKAMLDRHRVYRNYKILPLDEKDGLANILRTKEILDRHEYICFQGDRFLENTPTISCDFMGRPARFPIGPFLLASRFNVPIIFYFSMRERNRTYRFHFHIARSDDKGDGRKPEVRLLEQYVRALEGIVRKYPEQWFNFYPFWDQ